MTHRILVVDDEPDITALVAYHLAKAGFRVSTATNGPDALKAAREERPGRVLRYASAQEFFHSRHGKNCHPRRNPGRTHATAPGPCYVRKRAETARERVAGVFRAGS